MSEERPRLGAIASADVEATNRILAEVARTLSAQGVRLGGVVDAATRAFDCGDMRLVDVAGGHSVSISQNLGRESSGCRLDAQALAAVAGRLDQRLGEGIDLLILNKFGKAEAEGAGLIDLFGAAALAGIPVLTSVRPGQAEAFAAFHGGLATELPADEDRVLAWCRTALGD